MFHIGTQFFLLSSVSEVTKLTYEFEVYRKELDLECVFP